MPPPEILSSLPKKESRMGFGTELKTVRPKSAIGAKSTIELMANSGLKYVHATSRGRQGLEGDLEKSRKQLQEIGFVARENVEGDLDEYKTLLRENEATLSKKRQDQKLKEDSAAACNQI